jgi:hypothetical protein
MWAGNDITRLNMFANWFCHVSGYRKPAWCVAHTLSHDESAALVSYRPVTAEQFAELCAATKTREDLGLDQAPIMQDVSAEDLAILAANLKKADLAASANPNPASQLH